MLLELFEPLTGIIRVEVLSQEKMVVPLMILSSEVYHMPNLYIHTMDEIRFGKKERNIILPCFIPYGKVVTANDYDSRTRY